jgi:uncharacterized integral membrane protein (TIGR00698 family)
MITRQLLPGIGLAGITGLAIHFLAPYVPFINGIMLGLVVGILAGNFLRIPASFSAGVGYTSSRMLEWSILFLAFGIHFGHIAALGWERFLIVAAVVTGVLLVTVFLAGKLRCPTSAGWLVGFGTAICGSSAIAAVSPGISQNKEDAGIAMAVVNLMGSLGMLVLPFLLGWLAVSETNSGVIIGATLHSVANVAGAGYAMSQDIGDTSIMIKLARVAMLSPAVIFFTWMIKRSEQGSASWKTYFNLPYYLWGFMAITIFVSLVTLPDTFLDLAQELGKIVLTIAMVAIGLKVSVRQLLTSGKKAIGFGVIIFLIQVAMTAVLLFVLA